MKSRNITKNEINGIIQKCQPREQAIFTMMKQSGLSPNTIKKLKIKSLEPNTPIPCKINIPQEIKRNKFERHPIFVGEETVKYIQKYLKKDRKNKALENPLFTIRNKDKEIDTRELSRTFRITAKKIEDEKKTDSKQEKSDKLTLHSLINFYRENAKSYLKEIKNNPNKDDEFHRELYEEEAMPNLETETLTPEIHQLKNRIERMEEHIEILSLIEYKRTVNLMSKSPEEQTKELELTPEAYQKIWVENLKAYKRPSLRLTLRQNS